MPRTQWIEHAGKRLLYVDFSNTDTAGIKAAIAEAKPIIDAQAPFSTLCLVDAAGTKFSLDISDLVKDFTAHNKPYIKCTAIIGVAGIARVVLDTAIAFTKRTNLILKNSRAEALDYLASRP
jgi:hypothetical protein